MEFISPEGLRLDGRRPQELRRLKGELGVLEGADGSAAFEMGNTRVIAAVYGPRPPERRGDEVQEKASVRCEYLQAPFSTGERRRRSKTDRRALETANLVRDTVAATVLTELLPRSVIDVHLLVAQADGGLRACCINAAMLAIADAGVPCRDVVSATSVGLLDGTAVLDMNGQEDGVGCPELVLALHAGDGRVVSAVSDNKVALDSLEGMMTLAVEGCKAVSQALSRALQTHTRRKALASSALRVD